MDEQESKRDYDRARKAEKRKEMVQFYSAAAMIGMLGNGDYTNVDMASPMNVAERAVQFGKALYEELESINAT